MLTPMPDETVPDDATRDEQLDVLVVGAGISGVGVAHALRTRVPWATFAILEARSAPGGTWDLFRYPGVRSDSDLYTFGFDFKPWRDDQAIADAARIRGYLDEAIRDDGLHELIRLRHRVVAASWSSVRARWSVVVEHTDTGRRETLTCRWLFCAGGYYRYDTGYRPRFPGEDEYTGTVVHPQEWPADLDVAGRRVLVVGSGATAVTLVPALAGTAAHVTMLQRTPSYVLALPRRDPVAAVLRRLLGDARSFTWMRRKSIAQQIVVWFLCQRFPGVARRVLRGLAARRLPPGYPVDVHFNPPYGPWDQRLCVVPDGDLFAVLRSGQADVVTDRIETFTAAGVRVSSGTELEADIVVLATGLVVQPFGGIELTVDGEPVRAPDTVAYKGMMLSGVPNFAFSVGYTNLSWTLKVGPVGRHLCTLLAYLSAGGFDSCVPAPADPGMPTRPVLDFGAGYVRRAVDLLPRQGSRPPWRTSATYLADVRLFRRSADEHRELRFGRTADAAGQDRSTTRVSE
jgi:monooxygenase